VDWSDSSASLTAVDASGNTVSMASNLSVTTQVGSVVWSVPLSLSVGSSLSVSLTVLSVFPAGTVPQSVVQLKSPVTVVSIAYPYKWVVGPFGTCSASCGTGVQTASLFCYDVSSASQTVVSSSLCAPLAAVPATTQSCYAGVCAGSSFSYYMSPFGACSASCGPGVATRTVLCYDSNGNSVGMSNCESESPNVPSTTTACDARPCSSYVTTYLVTSNCTATCGGGAP